jgi:hypothetical protein
MNLAEGGFNQMVSDPVIRHPYLAAAYRRWKRDNPAKIEWLGVHVADYLTTPGPNDIDEFVDATDRLLGPSSRPPYTGAKLVTWRRSPR